MKYGYMDMEHHNNGRSAPLMSRDGLRKHILEFQRFAGIEQTGMYYRGQFNQHFVQNQSITFRANITKKNNKTR
jgi:hypothetical protein